MDTDSKEKKMSLSLYIKNKILDLNGVWIIIRCKG